MLKRILLAIALLVSLLLLSTKSEAMPFAVHAGAGSAIGAKCNSNAEVFALGILSHIALDTLIPHQYGIDWWGKGWEPDVDYIAVEVGGTATVVALLTKERDPKRIWGAVGGVLPDVVDAVTCLRAKGWDVNLPPHNGWPGYSKYDFTYNKAQTEVLTVLLVSLTVKF